MANDILPWAVARTLLADRLMELDKFPGIRQIGIGEIWRQILAKCGLKVAGAEAKDACSNAQLYAVLEAGIEGALIAARALFAEKEDEEEWGFLLVVTSRKGVTAE